MTNDYDDDIQNCWTRYCCSACRIKSTMRYCDFRWQFNMWRWLLWWAYLPLRIACHVYVITWRGFSFTVQLLLADDSDNKVGMRSRQLCGATCSKYRKRPHTCQQCKRRQLQRSVKRKASPLHSDFRRQL